MQYFTFKEADGTLLRIRDIESNDLPAVTEIYNHYVTHTAITFDIETFSAEQREPWFQQFQPGSPYQCLIVEDDDNILGYASSSKFRPKPAYDQSVEVTIYLDPGASGRGLGARLYQQLITNLTEQDVHRAYAIIALPNPQSIKLHTNHGFEAVGTLHEVGYKFGKYHDTLWLEKKFNTT